MKNALQSFQKTREWADLIQNLNRLHRVITKYGYIHSQTQPIENNTSGEIAHHHRNLRTMPLTVDCCKVLAMCLTPGHPAGVHLKTLEVYEASFLMISKHELTMDLGLWLCGLLPLASFASTRFETHTFLSFFIAKAFFLEIAVVVRDLIVFFFSVFFYLFFFGRI